MAAKAATGQVHQPLAKSPCLWPHFYTENLSLSLFCSIIFSFLPFPFLSSFFLSSLISFIFLPFSSLVHFYFPFPSPSCSFTFFFPFPFLFLFFSSLPSIFSFFSSSFPPPLMGG